MKDVNDFGAILVRAPEVWIRSRSGVQRQDSTRIDLRRGVVTTANNLERIPGRSRIAGIIRTRVHGAREVNIAKKY